MAYGYVRGDYFNAENYWEAKSLSSETVVSKQYYFNEQPKTSLVIENYGWVHNLDGGTISSGTIKDTGTLYVTGGSVSGIVVENGGWFGMVIDDAHIDDINFTVSASSASESIDFSYQKSVCR